MTSNRRPGLVAFAPWNSDRPSPLDSLAQTWGTLTRLFRKNGRQRHPLNRPALTLEVLEGRVTPAFGITSVTNSITGAATGGFGGSNNLTTLTITGTDLDTETINYVKFTNANNSYQVNPGTVTATTLTSSYPASMAEGTYTVTVGLPTGEFSGSTATIQILPPSATISPVSGPLAGGTPVTISGHYLDNASIVLFDSAGALDFNPAANTDSTIQVSSPPSGTAGPVTVYVQFPGSANQYSVGTFTYAQPEFTASGFYPNFASSAGQAVSVQGANLSSSTVSAVEIWNSSQSTLVASADMGQVTYATDGSYLTFNVPSGLTVDTQYSISIVAPNGGGNVFVSPPGGTNFSFVAAPVVPGTVVSNTSLTDDSTSLTISQLIATGSFTVLSTGDFASSGDLFIQTTNGVAILNYTGVEWVAPPVSPGAAPGYYLGGFTGVTQYTTIPSQYQGLGDFDTTTTSLVLKSHASVFQASSTHGYNFNVTQDTGNSDIQFFGYYNTATPPGQAPTFYVLKQVSGQNYQWVQTSANELVPTYTLPAGTTSLKLPLIPTNSANFIFTRGAYSPAIQTNSSGGVPRPSPYVGTNINPNAYDFVEYTFDSTAGDPNVNLGTRMLPKLTIDTSQVDQLGFPIQIQASASSVIPIQLETYPNPTTMTVPEMGVDPYFTLSDIFSAYKQFISTNTAYSSTLMEDPNNPNSYIRIANPSDVLSKAADATTNPLNWAFDQAIYDLFTTPAGGQLLINTGNAGGLTNATFTGTPSTVTQGNNSYKVLQFSSSANPSIGTLYVYMPLFSTNSTGAPNTSLYQSVPAPSWITPSSMTSGFMTFANAGVFTDSGSQPGLSSTQQTILGNIENQLVTALNRGVANVALGANYQNNTEMWQDPSQHYPAGQTSNAYGQFMHTYLDGGKTIFLGPTDPPQPLTYGLAYAIAYDDQGNLSTTMTVVNDITSPAVTLSSWAGGTAQATTTSLGSSLYPSNPGSVVTLTATVSATAGSPTGTVQFQMDGSNYGSPVAVVGGKATLTIPANTLSAGTYTFVAQYSGDSTFAPSSSQSWTQQVLNVSPNFPSPVSLAGGSAVASIGKGTALIKSADGTSFEFQPFPNYRGPLSVNTMDTNNDGSPDALLFAAGGESTGPHILLLDTSGNVLQSFYVFPGFKGFVTVAGGIIQNAFDPNNQGWTALILYGAGAGGQPTVGAIDAANGQSLGQFNAFAPEYSGGVHVAMSARPNTSSSSMAVISAAAANNVAVFDLTNTNQTLVSSFYAFFGGQAANYGVFATAGIFTQGGPLEVFVGLNGMGQSTAQAAVFSLNGSSTPVAPFTPFGETYKGAVRVGLADYDDNGTLDLLCATGPGTHDHGLAFNYPTLTTIDSVFLSNSIDGADFADIFNPLP